MLTSQLSLHPCLALWLQIKLKECYSIGSFKTSFKNLILDRKQKILLKELSFDEHAEVAGTELLAPVFLAIAEENDADTGIQGMRRKAQSIEDLCGIIDEPGGGQFLL